MSLAESRQPLPSQDEIAELPAGGGPEFNRLIFTQSPYLLQHARNPIDWFPWGEEAFAEAKAEDKPIFLSIGYTTCHWCHVMERESFEDEEVAAQLNEHYISVKVDREERPDIDEVYMRVTQALTGSGGWPMTVVMTPAKDPFFAGTYFPKRSVAGRAGMLDILPQLHQAWVEKRDDVNSTAVNISAQLASFMGGAPGIDLEAGIFDTAFAQFFERYDAKHGGFSVRPKFPVPPNLMFLLRYYNRTGNEAALEMVEKTLAGIRRGGIYDHIGLGVHRYSTDPEWLVPHFEKMLYDQALVTIANVEAFQVTGKERYARTAREILTYVERELTSPEGGFYSAEDADSEGEEGKFYIWTNAEVRTALGDDDGQFFIDTFQFEDEGNYKDEVTGEKTGANIPHLREELLDEARDRAENLRETLFAQRERRVHPEKDDKVLTDWNGLMIVAYASAAQAFGEKKYATIATRAADFIIETLTNEEGRLLKRYRNGQAGLTAHLEDYAFLIWGLLELYETNFEVRYLAKAIELQSILDEHFWDEGAGGYFTTADDSEKLIVRAKRLYGGAIPSGNAVEISNLSRLYRMTGNPDFASRGDELIRAFSGEIAEQPMVYPLVLCGLDRNLGPGKEIVISAPDSSPNSDAMIEILQKMFSPRQVILFRSEDNADELSDLVPYIETQTAIEGKVTAYVCRQFACKLPTTELTEMEELLKTQ